MHSNSLIAVITKNRTNPAYVGARFGAELVLATHKIPSVQFVPENPDDIAEQSELVRRAIELSPDAIVLAPAHTQL